MTEFILEEMFLPIANQFVLIPQVAGALEASGGD